MEQGFFREELKILNLPHKTSTSHIFPFNIERTWNIISNKLNLNDMLIEVHCKITLTNGTCTFEEGSSFEMSWDGNLPLILTCTEVIDTKDFKKLTLEVSSVHYNDFYIISQFFYRNSVDNSTLMQWLTIYIKETNILTQEEVVKREKIKKALMEKYEKFLGSSFSNLQQMETIVIKSELKEVWNIISNFGEFAKISEFVAEDVKCDRDHLEPGTIITLEWKKRRKLQIHVKVLKIMIEQNKCKYHVETLKNPNNPQQDIIFKVFEIKQINSCFIRFKHKFKDAIKFEFLDLVGEKKKSMLYSLKKHLEKNINNDI
jgi:hypothetical protein